MAAASETQENSEETKSANDGSEVSCNDNYKMKLKDLKVVDLKKELEKRELDKNGVKADLVERLKAAIVKEGEDPEEYDFEVNDNKNNCEKNEVSSAEISEKTKSKTEEDITEITSEKTQEDASEIVCDKAQEDKLEETLQLSIDEEEAQLNEEGLIDIPKESSSDKVGDITSADNGSSITELNLVSNQKQTEASSPSKTAKTTTDDAKPKKVGKSPSQNKSTENLNSSSPKAVKVIGKNEKSKGTTTTTSSSAKCLWVTGIPDTTRAADLKALFSKQGRVLAVKIVKNAKQTPSRCYGYVTMSTSKDATKAIQNLHRTELNGRTISVERAQNEPSTLLKKAEAKLLNSSSKKTTMKKEAVTPKKSAPAQSVTSADGKEKPKEDTKSPAVSKTPQETGKKKEDKISSSEKEKFKDKDRKPREYRERDAHRPPRRPVPARKPRMFSYNERPYGSFGRPAGRRPFTSRIGFGSSFKPRPSLAALQKLREERYQRERFRERRELEHRRLDEISRHRYIERKQREEAYRLEREKEKLRIERELLERERAEILKLEREKQRLERERLEREREELRRQAELRRSTKRPFSQVSREPEILWEERKKSSRYDGSASFHREASSGSRFEYPPRERASYSREYERHPERFSSRKHLETLPPPEFNDRDARREVTIRTRDDRHVIGRSDFRDRDRSFSSRERHSSSRREPPRDDWKHDRRVHERIISSSSSSGHRRMDFY